MKNQKGTTIITLVKDLIVDRNIGRLFQSNDVNSLIENMRRIINNPEILNNIHFYLKNQKMVFERTLIRTI